MIIKEKRGENPKRRERPEEERPVIINKSKGGTFQWHISFEAAVDCEESQPQPQLFVMQGPKAHIAQLAAAVVRKA